MFIRNHFNTLKLRIEEPRRFIQVIVGPEGMSIEDFLSHSPLELI